MMVDNDDGSGIPQDGDLEDFAGMNYGGIKDADAEKVGAHDLVAIVEQHNPCLFPVELGESVLEKGIDVFGILYLKFALRFAIADKLHTHGVLIKYCFGHIHLAFLCQHMFA